jgi:putative nucleotidyltransferase with HDIG domain
MTASEIVSQVKDLPVVSETARKMVVQLNQPELHRSELVKTLRCDNVLTAKLLRVCNSADCALREPVVSVDQALLLLGNDAVFRIVCTIGFGDSIGFGAPGYAAEANGLWNHSLSTAIGAEYLAGVEGYGNFNSSTAFTAGLLHDIGKIVINKILTPKARADIRTHIALQAITRVDAEKQVLGADHCEVGVCLLQRWFLPETIVEAVANHHRPVNKPEIKLSALVYLANAAAHLAGASPGWDAYAIHVINTSAKVLDIAPEKMEHTFAGIQNAMRSQPQLQTTA